MSNLWTLFGYEMKKIWTRKLNWIALVLFSILFVLIQVTSFLTDNNGATFTTVDGSGQQISAFISGNGQYRIRVRGSRNLAGQVMDEAFFRTARETIPLDAEWFEQESYFLLIDPSYFDFYSTTSEYLEGTAEEFYADRQAGIAHRWEKYLTKEDAAYWATMEAQVEKPFIYQPRLGPETILELFGVSGGGEATFLPVIIGICLCDLFALDRRTRAEGLIFTTRQSRRTLYLAKLLAGIASALLAALILAGVVVTANLSVYGTWGWDGAIQLVPWLRHSSLPITMGQAVLLLLGLMLAYALLCGGLTALVSVFTGSSVTALAASVGLMLLTMMQFSGDWAEFMPSNLVDMRAFYSLHLTDIFGLRLNLYQSGFLLYLLVTAGLLTLCYLGWRRNATDGR